MKQGLMRFCAILAGLCPFYAFGALSILDTAVNPDNGHTYYLLSNSTWTDAEAQAIALGGHLATVRSQTENAWIVQHWSTNRSLWIGLNDAAQEGTFVWASGETATYRNWNSGEPNNGGGALGHAENYTYIYGANVSGKFGKWNDYENLSTVPPDPALYGVVEVVPSPTNPCVNPPAGLVSWWRGEGAAGEHAVHEADHDLAAHLGISHSAVETRLHRARQRLRVALIAARR